MHNITIAGAGYVGLSYALFLAQHNNVIIFDIVQKKINMLNNRGSPIADTEVQEFLKNKALKFKATLDKSEAYKNADFVVIATPTNYDENRNSFDTRHIESMVKDVLKINVNAIIIIKSTVAIGYTQTLRKKFSTENIIFCPEFLREGRALYDILHPGRIVIGDKSSFAKTFVALLKEGAIKKKIPTLFTNNTEAEAIKLFSNAYLAMRIAYFNELDSFCEKCNLKTKDIIDGIGLDPRIGKHYNNPSFGYGGYCFPKDTKQLKANFQNVPHNLITAIVDSNTTRKEFIVNQILSKSPHIVGVYRLIMKFGSDNFRNSAVQDIIKQLQHNGIKIVIYEPSINDYIFDGATVLRDINTFKHITDVVLANRMSNELIDIKDKVYTRDIFNRDI